MDVYSALPTMKASAVLDRARNFASVLVQRLEDFNRQHPEPEMSPEAREYFEKEYSSSLLPPDPKNFILVFEATFCRYMASQIVIVPDQSE